MSEENSTEGTFVCDKCGKYLMAWKGVVKPPLEGKLSCDKEGCDGKAMPKQKNVVIP